MIHKRAEILNISCEQMSRLTPDGGFEDRGSALGRILILDFAYVSRKFPSDPRLFPLKTKKYLHRHLVDF
jgi:hypothetical protein